MTWKDLEDEMSDVCTDEFAVPIKHVPMKRDDDVNARPGADNSRPVQTMSAREPTKPLRGIFSWPYQQTAITKGRAESATPRAAFHSSRNPTLSVEDRDMTSEIIEHDIFELVGKNLKFSVLDIQPDGEGRMTLQLNQIGRAPRG